MQREMEKKITAKNDINESVRLVLNVSKIFSQEEEQGVWKTKEPTDLLVSSNG